MKERIGKVLYIIGLLAVPLYNVFFTEFVEIDSIASFGMAVLMFLVYLVLGFFVVTAIYWMIAGLFGRDECACEMRGCCLPYVIIFVVMIVIGLVVSLFSNNSNDGGKNNYLYGDEQQTTDSVYVCISEGSYAFHKKFNCRALHNCSYSIEKVSIETARKIGREPCGICSK